MLENLVSIEVGLWMLLVRVGTRVDGGRDLWKAIELEAVAGGWPGRVDVDGSRRSLWRGSAVDEALGVSSEGGVEDGGVDGQDGVDAAVVHIGGRQEGDAGVPMFVVVLFWVGWNGTRPGLVEGAGARSAHEQ